MCETAVDVMEQFAAFRRPTQACLAACMMATERRGSHVTCNCSRENYVTRHFDWLNVLRKISCSIKNVVTRTGPGGLSVA